MFEFVFWMSSVWQFLHPFLLRTLPVRFFDLDIDDFDLRDFVILDNIHSILIYPRSINIWEEDLMD